ncbi:Sulfite reductase,dissimilatory-type subunit alpha [Trichinella pseudospiralis]
MYPVNELQGNKKKEHVEEDSHQQTTTVRNVRALHCTNSLNRLIVLCDRTGCRLQLGVKKPCTPACGATEVEYRS